MKKTLISLLFLVCSQGAHSSDTLEIKGITVDQVVDCENIKNISDNNSRAYNSCLNNNEKTLFFTTSFLDRSTPLLVSLSADRRVSIVMIKNFDFEKALNSLEAKYGPAEKSDSVIQNRMGAKFDQRTATWRNGKIRLEIKRHGSKLNESVLSLAGETAIESGRESLKPSSDL